jgi:hypothetical protein
MAHVTTDVTATQATQTFGRKGRCKLYRDSSFLLSDLFKPLIRKEIKFLQGSQTYEKGMPQSPACSLLLVGFLPDLL